MLSLTYFAVAIGFPVVALLTRQRGRRSLWLVTGVAIGVVVLLALFLASSWGGNRLVETEGFPRIAFAMLRLATLTLIVPILAAACTIAALGAKASSALAYSLAFAVTLMTMIAGLLSTIWLGR